MPPHLMPIKSQISYINFTTSLVVSDASVTAEESAVVKEQRESKYATITCVHDFRAGTVVYTGCDRLDFENEGAAVRVVFLRFSEVAGFVEFICTCVVRTAAANGIDMVFVGFGKVKQAGFHFVCNSSYFP